MNPYLNTVETIAAVDRELRAWASRLLVRANLKDVRVNDPDAPFQLQLTADKFAPWPKVTEPPQNISILGRGENIHGVPDPWPEIARLITMALDQSFPKIEAKGTRPERLSHICPLEQLPAPLRSWYEKAGEEPEPWVIHHNGKPSGRLPSLEWRQAMTALMKYGVAVTGEDASITMQTFGLLSVGVYLDRVLTVRVPPLPVGDRLPPLMLALAEVLGGENGERLADHANRLTQPADQKFTLLPVSEDWVFAVQFSVGAGPILSPSITPMIQTTPGGAR